MMAARHFDLALLALLVAVSCATQNAAALSGSSGVRSVRDAYALMYREQSLTGGAYLLLNATAAVGSASGGADDSAADADAPLVHLARLPRGGGGGGDDGGPWAVLVPAAEANAFLEELAADDALAARVAAVLVDDTDPPRTHSSLPPFPGAEFAPYAAPGYAWNPAGTGAAARRWRAPVMLLTPERAADARERADYNAAGAAAAAAGQRRGQRPQYRARVRMRMSAAGAANASACLAERSCAPLGGYSVWAAWPPLTAGANATLPTTLVVAQVDGFDLFHDSIQGANAPVSGLVAMLAAAQLLSDGTDGSGACGVAAAPTRSLLAGSGGGTPKRQIVFLALAGEPWGYMGSKALLWELEQRTANVEGLDWGLVDQVLEIGPVGLSMPASKGGGSSSSGSSSSSNGKTAATSVLYAHKQRGGAFGDAAPLVAALQRAGDGLQGSSDLPVDVKPASANNPGVPPSSLMSFLRAKPTVAGAVLAEFDRAWTDPYQGGRFDTGDRVDAEAVARAAALVARTVHALACGDAQSGSSSSSSSSGGAKRAVAVGGDLPVNATAARALARGYLDCFTTASPGLACAAAAPLIDAGYTEDAATGARSYAAKHYVGVLQFMYADAQTPALKSDATRLIWGLLATATATRGGGSGNGSAPPPAGAACDPLKAPCPTGQVCVGYKPSRGRDAAAGACKRATVKYVPSLSTRVACVDCGGDGFEWRVTSASDAWAAAAGWPDDPMWVESNWPAGEPFLQLYLLKPWRARVAVLAAGVVLTSAALAAALAARRVVDAKLKSS